MQYSEKALSNIFDLIYNAESISLCDIEYKNTILIIVDMINGFVNTGIFSNPRNRIINHKISIFSQKCDDFGIKKLAFADAHDFNSTEFLSYPQHCIKGSYESEITDEIKSVGNYTLINKNSTNGFLEPEFKIWLEQHKNVDTFILVGNCTDICVLQMALSLKAEFNRLNKNSNIIIPMNMVETYDNEEHSAELMNLIMLYNLSINGIKIVKEII